MNILMKTLGALTKNEEVCETSIYFANTQSPLLQELQERQQKPFDANYSKEVFCFQVMHKRPCVTFGLSVE